ncbi:MAG: hypothetical protein LAN84_16685 [Acidobacteriia bacterium]|nr:hypothetical protein [Terriglobia bacterium]
MTSPTRAPLSACRSALIGSFLKSALQPGLDEKGYVSEAGQNLIEGVRLDDFESDLRQGDGNELEGKFRAAHSSSALAVNTFAPFKANATALRFPGIGGFASVHFERKCPHGLVGRRSPNLDVLADGPNGVVAVESKCLEILTPHKAKFAPAYEDEIKDERRRTAWFREMTRLVEKPHTYRWLDAAQLVKHAFGLAYGEFVNRRVTLLYLYWEPSNPEAYPTFAEHRAEVTRFAASIIGGGPEFVAMSYPELWRWWEAHPEPEWLPTHVGRLRARYGVAA